MAKEYIYPATLLCDFYKVDHHRQYPQGTQVVYSTFTPRGSRLENIDHVVVFGIQAFIKKWLIDYFDRYFFNRDCAEVINEYKRVIKYTLGIDNPDAEHIKKLWENQVIPLKIKALPEGTLCPLKTPVLTIENTNPDLGWAFYWFTNYIETLMSTELWQPMTNATIAFEFRKIMEHYAKLTGADLGFVKFQGHDFSMRGMAGVEAGKSSGAAHLLSFVGTDTIPAILFHEEFYNANIETELVGTSVPATEHSVMCAYGQDGEKDLFEHLLTNVYPNGIFSAVSDTWDFWKVVGEYLPELKDKIIVRDGKLTIRPDSGNPVQIVCGDEIMDLTNDEYIGNIYDCEEYMKEILSNKVDSETPHGEHGESYPEAIFKYQDKYYEIVLDIFWNRHDKQYYYMDGVKIQSCKEIQPTLEQLGLIECLWNIFGGKVNNMGFKELDSHIGAIYGDSINMERCEEILKRLMAKGFASTNIVFGIGSYTYQFNTRDTFNFAVKATHIVVNGRERQIFKDPKTDSGMKKSQKGRLVVTQGFDDIQCQDELSIEEQQAYEILGLDLLELVFEDSELKREQSLSEIRNKLEGYL